MKAIWLIRWQELAGRIRYWTAIIGYDPRDRSIINLVYLLYLVIFFSIWGLAVLSLLSDLGTRILGLAGALAPLTAAISILTFVLFLVACIQGYQSGVHSPFIFSDTDAELICQAPVDRSQVALAWFLGDWFPSGLLFTALAIVLCFASLQISVPGGFEWAHLPTFLIAGVKTAWIAFPLHMAFTSLVYSLGALRLQRNSDVLWLRWIPLGVGVSLVIILSRGLPVAKIILWPVWFPLQAAFGLVVWLPGFIVAILFLALSVLALYWSSRELNLSRAAQESRFRWALQQVNLLGDTRLNQAMKIRQRLGFGHSVSRIPGREGVYSLFWKECVVTTRSLRFSAVFTWLGIFVVCVVMLLTSDWGTRLWAFIIWGLLVARQCTDGLRADLGVWSLTRQLPFSAREFIFAECAIPTSVAILICWVSLILSFYINSKTALFLIVMLPVGVVSIVLSTVFDLMRNCHTTELFTGQVAEPGAVGLILGLILAALPILLASWLVHLFPAPVFIILISFLGLGLAFASAYGVWSLASYTYKHIN